MALTSQARRMRAHIAVGVAAIAAMATACTSTTTNTTPPTGIFGLTGGSGSGTGGSGGGSGGIDVVATYTLKTVNGSALPALLVDDSVVTTDSMHIFRAWLDSALISLNSDTTAIAINFVSLFETRTGTGLSGATYTGDSVVTPDTLTGTYQYNVTAATVLVSLVDTVNSSPVYTSLVFGVTTDSLVADVTYTVFDLSGIPQTTTAATFVYTNSGPSLQDVLSKPLAPTRAHAAASRNGAASRVIVAPWGLSASQVAAVRHVAILRRVPGMQLQSASALLPAFRR